MKPDPINYIAHATAFSEHVKGNKSLHPNHVSLYWALFYTWNQFHFTDIFPVNRRRLKVLCRIGSNNTYARCIKDLHMLGLINYMPASYLGMPSYISMTRLSKKGELIVDNSLPRISFDTTGSIKTDIVPCIKTDTDAGTQTDTSPVSEPVHFSKQFNLKRNRRAPNGEVATVDNSASLPEVMKYFALLGFPLEEARKFFYYYEAVGWKIGGEQIRDWRFAVHKWGEHIMSFTKKTYDHGNTAPGDIGVNQDKRYDIPL